MIGSAKDKMHQMICIIFCLTVDFFLMKNDIYDYLSSDLMKYPLSNQTRNLKLSFQNEFSGIGFSLRFPRQILLYFRIEQKYICKY